MARAVSSVTTASTAASSVRAAALAVTSMSASTTAAAAVAGAAPSVATSTLAAATFTGTAGSLAAASATVAALASAVVVQVITAVGVGQVVASAVAVSTVAVTVAAEAVTAAVTASTTAQALAIDIIAAAVTLGSAVTTLATVAAAAPAGYAVARGNVRVAVVVAGIDPDNNGGAAWMHGGNLDEVFVVDVDSLDALVSQLVRVGTVLVDGLCHIVSRDRFSDNDNRLLGLWMRVTLGDNCASGR